MRDPAGAMATIEVLDLDTGMRSVLLSDPRIGDFTWVPDGRIVYIRAEDPPNQSDSNLWQVAVDPQTAELRGVPIRLTNWGGFSLAFVSASSDGRRLFAVGNRWRSNIYLADLTGARPPKRLTLEWLNWATAWSNDSTTVFFNSDHNGNRDIFRQRLNELRPEAVVTGSDHSIDARISPDGRWILYFSWPDEHGRPKGSQGHLMRIPIHGGPAQPVLEVGTFPNSEVRQPRFRCPGVPGSPCVLSEAVDGQVLFSAIDPVEGRKQQLFRFPLQVRDAWDISRDGKWIAWTHAHTNRVRLLPVAGQPAREFELKGWRDLQTVTWAHDGSALFGTIGSSFGDPLVRVSLKGDVNLLYRGSKYVQSPVASPDGRWLAFTDRIADANAWVIEPAR